MPFKPSFSIDQQLFFPVKRYTLCILIMLDEAKKVANSPNSNNVSIFVLFIFDN